MKGKFSRVLPSAGVLMAVMAGTSFAQEAATTDDSADEIIVTGSSIRGVAPSGSNVIGLNAEDIASSGAPTTQELLSQLPQAVNLFNNVLVPGGNQIGGSARANINRPNLRNLPGGATATGAQTLLLMDGHRIVGSGVGILAVDPEAIAPGALSGVETITDGGSSVYGSDAIGGVINFITRQSYDGVQVGGHYGFADAYDQWDATVSAGTEVAGASMLFTYTFATHDALLGRDRDFIQRRDWSTGLPLNQACADATLTRSSTPGVEYLGSDPTTPLATPLRCDDSDYTSFTPDSDRHNAFAGFNIDVASNINLDIRALYAQRDERGTLDALRTYENFITSTDTGVIIPTTNYYRQQLGGFAGETQTAYFDYGSVLGPDSQSGETHADLWQLTPTLTWEVSDTWQVRGMANYGESRTWYSNRIVDTAAQAAALASSDPNTALNPYDIAATQNYDVIYDIGDFYSRGSSRNQMTNFRVIADGELLQLPAGPVQLAVGSEFYENEYTQRLGAGAAASAQQETTSFFAEASVPIFSPEQNIPGLHSLTLSLSGRADNYNDFGVTNNPQVGFTYNPVEWITLRGTWGKAFNAPTPPDLLGIPRARAIGAVILPAALTDRTGISPGAVTFVVDQAAGPNLQPQEAETYSGGFTIEPPIVPNLSISATYYHIDLTNFINSPATASGIEGIYANFPQFLTINATGNAASDLDPATVAAFFASLPAASRAQLTGAGYVPGVTPVAAILDNRNFNLGTYEISGLDFNAQYFHDTSFGSVDFSLSGNYQLELNSRSNSSAPWVNNLRAGGPSGTDGPPRFRAAFSAGADIGEQIRAQATVNYTGGFDVSGVPLQSHVDSFTTVNTFLSYQFEGEGLAGGRALTLNVNNILDTDPPEYRYNFSSGFDRSFTLGRLIQIGFTQEF